MSEKSKLLEHKDVVLVLIGGPGGFVSAEDAKNYKMPYLSGPDICDVAQKFGQDIDYGVEKLSREMYFDELVDYCDKKRQIDDLINYLFSPDNFAGDLKRIQYSKIQQEYEKRKKITISELNSLLWSTKYTFVELGDNVFLTNKSSAKIETPVLSKNDENEVISLYKNAQEDILIGDYATALIKAETMIDKALRYGAEKRNKKFGEKVSFREKYKYISELYNIKTSNNLDKRITKLASAMNTIVVSISEMRNHDSLAHSHDYPLNIKDYHARFAVNCALTFCEFLFSIYEAN